MGLRLLTEDLRGSADPRDKERLETLDDVNNSARAALDILNDLLRCVDWTVLRRAALCRPVARIVALIQ